MKKTNKLYTFVNAQNKNIILAFVLVFIFSILIYVNPSTSQSYPTQTTYLTTIKPIHVYSNYYSDSSVEISITTHTEGIPSEPLTYFVADVKFKDSYYLQSAFPLTSKKASVSQIAKENNAIFAINADNVSYRNNGVIMRNGFLLFDKPRRDGMAITKDGQMFVYKENEQTDQYLNSIGAVHSFSFGPILLDNYSFPKDLGSYYEVDSGKSINGKHPRTGICIVQSNHFKLIVVDGRDPKYSNGITLNSFAKLFKNNGCKTAYNLDGGGSSTFYFNDVVFNRPSDGQERRVSEAIFIPSQVKD